MTFGIAGTIANVHPYAGIFAAQNSSNLTFKNAGTAASPLSGGASNNPAYIYVDNGVNTNVRVQRCYLTATRTSVYLGAITSKGLLVQDCVGTVGSLQTLALNAQIRKVRAASNSVTAGASVYGTHYFDMFESDTLGRLWFAMNEPTSFTEDYVTLTLKTAGIGGFTSGGQVSMQTAEDKLVIELPYFVKGHTGFNALCPIFTGTNPANFSYKYDIDTGLGFAGNYNKNLMKIKVRSAGGTSGTNTITVAATNSPMPEVGDNIFAEVAGVAVGATVTDVTGNVITVSANFTANVTGSVYFMRALLDEAISPSTGFKLRMQIETTDAINTNAITYIRLNTTTTLAHQQGNMYPLEIAAPTLTLTGLTTGTVVAVFNSDYTTELIRSTLVGTTFSYPYEWNSDTGNFGVKILVWKDDKVPFIVSLTLDDEDQSVPLTQSEDLVYDDGYTNTHTIDFANELIILDSGNYNVQEVYSLWKDTMLLTTNAKYDFAFTQVGGNSTGGSNSVPFYTFLSNGWKIRPEEVSGTVNVVGGILLTDDSGDPFTDTLGAYTVRINYQQPVQAITVSTGGTVAPSASEMRSAIGLASANLDTQLGDLPTAEEIREEMDDNSTELAAIKGKTNLIPGLF